MTVRFTLNRSDDDDVVVVKLVFVEQRVQSFQSNRPKPRSLVCVMLSRKCLSVCIDQRKEDMLHQSSTNGTQVVKIDLYIHCDEVLSCKVVWWK